MTRSSRYDGPAVEPRLVPARATWLERLRRWLFETRATGPGYAPFVLMLFPPYARRVCRYIGHDWQATILYGPRGGPHAGAWRVAYCRRCARLDDDEPIP